MIEKKKMPNYVKFLLSGAAGMTAICFVQPLDLVKTRMQMTGVSGGQREYKNSVDCFTKVVRSEGILQLWKGIGAGLLRQATYTTTRMGIYQILMDKYKQFVQHTPTLGASMCMGITAGAAGAIVGNPAEVILIRMVTDGKLPPEQKRNYKNVADALARITNEEGVKGLWTGCSATVCRSMVVNMVQLSAYTQFKNYLHRGPLKMKEGFGLHLVSSGLSGFLTSVVSLPLDIAKTRIQNMKTSRGAKPEYTGTLDAVTKICQNEGVLALWKGFTPYLFRIAPQTILTLVFLEQYSKLYYKYVLGTTGGTSL